MNYRIMFFVMSCMIGSGIFFTPFNLQFLGINSFISFFIISCLFTYIGYLFSNNDTGGQSIFERINNNLGPTVGFFSTWLYWVVAWSSIIIIVGEMYRYFARIFPYFEHYPIATKCSFVIIFLTINCFKNKFRSASEMTINVLKIIPLIVFPILCFTSMKFNISNISGTFDLQMVSEGLTKIMWCFIGIEDGAIIGKNKSNLKSVVIGILLVNVIYIANLMGIFGVMGYKLASYTPYTDIMSETFGVSAGLLFSVVVFLVAAGCINSLIVSSGEIAVDSSKLSYFPKFLQKQNNTGGNYFAVVMSCVGLIPLCFLETNEILRQGVDIASLGFILFYMIFCISYFREKKSFGAFIASILCLGLICWCGSFNHLLVIGGILLIGLPLYISFKHNSKNSNIKFEKTKNNKTTVNKNVIIASMKKGIKKTLVKKPTIAAKPTQAIRKLAVKAPIKKVVAKKITPLAKKTTTVKPALKSGVKSVASAVKKTISKPAASAVKKTISKPAANPVVKSAIKPAVKKTTSKPAAKSTSKPTNKKK